MKKKFERELTNLEVLILRACKVENPENRLRSIYRRFYCSIPTHANEVMANNLDELVSVFNLCSVQRYLKILSPSSMFTVSDESKDDYWLKNLTALSRLIRYTNREDLPPFTAPARFRD